MAEQKWQQMIYGPPRRGVDGEKVTADYLNRLETEQAELQAKLAFLEGMS